MYQILEDKWYYLSWQMLYLIWQELHKIITCMDGFIKFYQGYFSEAKELFMWGQSFSTSYFQYGPLNLKKLPSIIVKVDHVTSIMYCFVITVWIISSAVCWNISIMFQSFIPVFDSKGELDPRELISLYPEMEPLCETFHSQLVKVNNAKELLALRQEDRTTFQQYLDFLGDFLMVVRGTKQGVECSEDIDTAQLRMYTEQGDRVDLDALVSSPNSCSIDKCVPLLELHKRWEWVAVQYKLRTTYLNLAMLHLI